MPEDENGLPALRASDADRDRAIELLRSAVADGRLDTAEFEERVDAALAGRTMAALAAVTADLTSTPGANATAAAAVLVPADPPVELLTLREKHGLVRRDGRWTLPHRLALRTAWSAVTLDLTRAVRSGPELVIEMRVRGGEVELVLAPGMVVDANGLAARFAEVAIGRDGGADPGDETPEILYVRLVGRIKHGSVKVRWENGRGA